MREKPKYESFYTDSIDYNEDYVDILEVLHKRKQVFLYIDEPEMALGGCDEDGEEIYETYLTRVSFYALIAGLEEKGYTVTKEINNRK